MWSLFRLLMDVSLLKPIIRPITRLLVGCVAVPLFRLFTKRVLRFETLDTELEKDLEQWFRGALILLLATQNMETTLFPWVEPVIQAKLAQMAESDAPAPGPLATGDDAEDTISPSGSMLVVNGNDYGWILLGLRVMLAIGVIQMMPDQELFAVIHSTPPKPTFDRKKKAWPQIKAQAWPFVRGHICVHLNKSSPVFAILAAIAPGLPGWICYGMALLQYLIIGLITTRDKAINVLSLFDEEVERRRKELIEEFRLKGEPVPAAHASPEGISATTTVPQPQKS